MIKQQRQGSFGAGLATALAVVALLFATFTRAQDGPAADAPTSASQLVNRLEVALKAKDKTAIMALFSGDG